MKYILIYVLLSILSGHTFGHLGAVNSSGCNNQKNDSYQCHYTGTSDYCASNSETSSSVSPHRPHEQNRHTKSSKDRTVSRSAAARRAFVKSNACPSTGHTKGKCPGYHVDHIVPLACGGADAPSNMQWLSAEANLKKGSMGCKN